MFGRGEVLEDLTVGERDVLSIGDLLTDLVGMAAHPRAADSCEVVEAVIGSRGPLAEPALAGGEGVHAGVWARAVNKGTFQEIHWYRR